MLDTAHDHPAGSGPSAEHATYYSSIHVRGRNDNQDLPSKDHREEELEQSITGGLDGYAERIGWAQEESCVVQEVGGDHRRAEAGGAWK